MEHRLEELERRLGEVEAEARAARETAAACRAELRGVRRRAWLASMLGLASLVVGLTFGGGRPGQAGPLDFTPLTLRNPFTGKIAFQFVGTRAGNELRVFNQRGQRLATLGASDTGGMVRVFDTPDMPLAVLGRVDGTVSGASVSRGLTIYEGQGQMVFLGAETIPSQQLDQHILRMSTPLDGADSIYLGTQMFNGVEDTRGLGVVTHDGTTVELGSHDPEHTRGYVIRQVAKNHIIAAMSMQKNGAGVDYGQLYTEADGEPPLPLFLSPQPP